MKKFRKVIYLVLFTLFFCSMNILSAADTVKDVNGDGSVTKDDALLLVEKYVNSTLTDEEKQIYDFNGDGEVNTGDAQALMKEIDPDFLLGDVTKDGILTKSDLMYLLNATIGTVAVTYEDYLIGDMDWNGVLNVRDSMAVGRIMINPGDINRDGKVNSTDAALVLDRYKENNATYEDIEIADINEDKKLNSTDAAMILDIYKRKSN